ncbi:hypothetical protein WMY93_026625 [Mugilogobius chulae]|uniref:Ig-like domain-containing protein n=1 Tax=Mugilogobius chulae TaxID=88201 RepID=A0AAW0MZK6_9GOBI
MEPFQHYGGGVPAVSPGAISPTADLGLAGSCVVIPCSFSPSAPPLSAEEAAHGRPGCASEEEAIFFPLRSTAFNSEDRTRGRLLSEDQQVNRDDSHMFEIALKRGGELLWGKPSMFHLDIFFAFLLTDEPAAPVISGISAFTEGQLVTLNCSVDFSCVSKPPSLMWSWDRGAQLNSTEPGGLLTQFPQPHRPQLVSTLSFTATHQVQPRVRCEAVYPEGKSTAALKDMHVTFSPKDVRVQVQTLSVYEGGSALVSCSCKADPPVSEYRWSYVQHGRSVHLHQKTHTVRLYNVTRGMTVHCSALNLIGRGESPPLLLNVQYKPTILERSSFCAWNDAEVLCHCAVQSQPGPSITWSVNGSVPPEDYNVSFTSHSHTITAVMKGQMDSVVPVVCYAVNALGNDSALLLLGGKADSPLLWLILPAVAICFIALICSIGLCCLRNRTKKRMLRRHLAAYPENLGIYQDRMPLYINCTEVTHIYTNGSYQLVYQNCTPCFVRNKQIRPMGRRGGERRRGAERGARQRQTDLETRQTVQIAPVADADTGIYLEIL